MPLKRGTRQARASRQLLAGSAGVFERVMWMLVSLSMNRVRAHDGAGLQPLWMVRMFSWGFGPRLVWDAPLALEFDGPKAQRHSSLGHRPRLWTVPNV